jgi:two-component system, NtrC family, response regulator AtoC
VNDGRGPSDPHAAATADVNSVRDGGHESWLVISSVQGVVAVLLPRKARVVIGRSKTCDIVIEDGSVSREHSALFELGGGLRIEDLGSRNKTKVMGRSLMRGETAPVAVGSVIEIGHATMFLQMGQPPVAPASPPNVLRKVGAGAAIILDPTMQRLYGLLDVIAPSPLNVIVLGETGTGKEVLAEAVHTGSDRVRSPFLRINCAGLTGSLLESELFGHERGAFTGAVAAKPGLFESASGGTVFLDEIGELPLDTQAKLLRVTERGEVTRLGSVQPRRVDVRYVAATNRDLQQLIAESRFRSDLFFRLNGFTVTLPPLRKRPTEVVPLARFFLDRVAQGRPYVLDRQAETSLEAYGWPGNVRELKNVVERAIVLAGPARHIEPHHLQLPESLREEERMVGMPVELEGPNGAGSSIGAPPVGAIDLRAQRDSWERQQIVAALERTSGNQKAAAVLLGISRRTLLNKMAAYAIRRPRKG